MDKQNQIFDEYGNYVFPTDIKQKGVNTVSSCVGKNNYSVEGNIPENAVVLTREEYDELDKCRWNNKKVADILLRFEEVEGRIRKETAEKLLDKVDYESNGQTKAITDLLRKEYGVELNNEKGIRKI